MADHIQTLGDLRKQRGNGSRPVRQEIRDNLVRKLQSGEPLFPGIIGHDDTVIPQLVNAILSRHNFILLGLRGQAKSRIRVWSICSTNRSRSPGCEIHDDPMAPDLRRLPRPDRERRRPDADRLAATRGPIREKLATPDVTIADMVLTSIPSRRRRRA
jgi:magnesium chelatase subunit I